MGKYVYVRVQFKESKEKDYGGFAFMFKYPYYKEPRVRRGDLVLCETRYGISLGQVYDVNTECPDKKFVGKELKSVIQVLDLHELPRKTKKRKS